MRGSVIAALVCVAVIGLAFLAVSSGRFGALRGSPIEGTWRGDLTDTMNEIYGRHGAEAEDASTTVTFHRGGTFTSDDSATLIAVAGPRKGTRSDYVGHNSGTFSFRDGSGTAKETSGERTVGGRPLAVRLPGSVTLKLRDSSTLVVVEDYGKEGRFHYLLKRQ